MFDDLPDSAVNHFRFRFNPDVAISIGARVKLPGEEMLGREVELVAHRHVRTAMAPYERLLGDALEGDSVLFTRDDCVEEAWRVLDPVLGDRVPVQRYAAGSWGPEAADALTAGFGGWNDPEPAPAPKAGA